MPTLGKGTKFGKIRLSKVQKSMSATLVLMIFPVSMNIKRSEFQYPAHNWKVLCGIMTNLVGQQVAP